MTNWKFKIDLGAPFDPESTAFPEHADRAFRVHRDRVVKVIRNSRWLRETRFSLSLSELIDELAETESIEDFDEVFSEIYDLADRDECWIEVTLW